MVRIKPDILKLDRSLISGIHRDASKIALLEAMARFATTTGAAVCAEGIEEIDELRVLGRFDVTYGQGYALGRPGPDWPGVDAAVAADGDRRGPLGHARDDRRRRPPAARSRSATSPTRSATCGRAPTSTAPSTWSSASSHADDVAVSLVVPGERCVETLSTHDWGADGERYSFDDYPTTERVIVHQTLGQVLEGDPARRPGRARSCCAESGFSAVLLAPIIFHGETIGLLEIYRRTARPWTGTEVDQVRMLAHQLSGVLAGPQLGISSAVAQFVVDVSERDTAHPAAPPLPRTAPR